MSMIERRIRRLEEDMGGDARLLVVFAGGASDQAVADMLMTDHGITVGRADRLVHFATIYEDRDGNALPEQAPPTHRPTGSGDVLRRGVR